MRIMYDSVTPRNILKANPKPQMVGGYINGRYKWSDADWALFPDAVHVRISVRASFLDGDVLDVEPGDADPSEVPAWLTARRKAGADPSVYCNRSTWPQVAAACKAAGIAEPHYFIATASGRAQIPAGAVAAQYLLDIAPGIDVSAVADYWPGVDPITAKNGGFLMALNDTQQAQLYTWVKGLYDDASETWLANGKGSLTQGKALAQVYADVKWMAANLGNTPDMNKDGRAGDVSLLDFRQFLVNKLNEIDALLKAQQPGTVAPGTGK
ncbi:hypothetical protein [Amycolatopsis sp. VC5-11]|uniref:hypothetical protein n=1 Tax=Amycolatopsis sp. VC5-11 TaxID=3120156 RepID=UPI00300B26F5